MPLLLVAAPAFDLAFSCGSIIQALEMLMEHEDHRSLESNVYPLHAPVSMLGYAFLQAADGRPDIDTSRRRIGRCRGRHSWFAEIARDASFETLALRAPQDDGGSFA